ncbi:hypothetical protein [Rhizobium paranaense]|uniref:Uncharacterized protein n=1 Tax=Rhizobium paranaense TaxID=1650438 RepID=A0A7W8XX61_9HYPH|nr:hypothetical protein [Rhizobium paranaense]MBB5577238.1 hypothetical protein [Rhizobium paranaense]
MKNVIFSNAARRLTCLMIETSVLIAGVAAILIVGLPSVRPWL